MTKNQEYALQYADYAMAQMRRYGIPASVTLAQGILESSNGQSRLARNENNHFGIKATSSWIAEGGKYGIYTDDKPNEKFCSYDSVGDSYEHHSRFLKENSRYAGCFKLSPDDYKGWAQSIEKAGYATGGKYAENLQKIIEQNGLQKYDRQVMQEMTAQGRQFGVEHNPLQTSESAEHGTGYSFPVEREEFLFITSPFGTRQDPLDSTKQQMHKGVDIRCKADAVLATESGGKVVAVNQNKNTPGGKSLTVEYARTDGSKVQCTYMHLKEISVKVGDKVSNWNGLGVQLSSLFGVDTAPQQEGYEYLAVLVTVVNRTKDQTFTIGAQNVDAIDAAYPVPPASNVDANFHALAADTTDFVASCDGQTVECTATISLYNQNSQSFSDSTTLPPQGSGYVQMLLMVPKGWKELEVTYMPTFVADKTLTFTMKAADVTRA